MAVFKPNTLYYGDNLGVLRDFPPECVDLVYLDPPFNSNRSYNVLFKEARGTESEAQIQAFEDTWHWGREGVTAATYDEVVRRGDEVARMLQAFVDALGHNDVTAYLTMMAPRLVELRRVLKPTGSIYLHCDPTAGHYLKVLMDSVFGAMNFKNEITWKRTSAHSDVSQGAKHFGRIADTILFYAKSEDAIWNIQYGEYSKEYIDTFYRHLEEGTGRRYRIGDLTAAKPGGDTEYEWTGPDGRVARPYKGRYWAYSRANMEQFEREGRLVYSQTGMPQYKRYLDEMPGSSTANDLDGRRFCWPFQRVPWLRHAEAGGAAGAHHPRLLQPRRRGPGPLLRLRHRRRRRPPTGPPLGRHRRHLAGRRPHAQPPHHHLPGRLPRRRSRGRRARRRSGSPGPGGARQVPVPVLGRGEAGRHVPRRESRKGRDRGVDGVIAFPEMDPERPKPTPDYKQVIISVKGGATGPAHVRELAGTVEREKAAIGVLVVTQPPTREMVREAASAGLYHSTWDGAAYPKLQILTASEVVQGGRVAMPSLRGIPQYAPAKRASRGAQGRLDV